MCKPPHDNTSSMFSPTNHPIIIHTQLFTLLNSHLYIHLQTNLRIAYHQTDTHARIQKHSSVTILIPMSAFLNTLTIKFTEEMHKITYTELHNHADTLFQNCTLTKLPHFPTHLRTYVLTDLKRHSPPHTPTYIHFHCPTYMATRRHTEKNNYVCVLAGRYFQGLLQMICRREDSTIRSIIRTRNRSAFHILKICQYVL